MRERCATQAQRAFQSEGYKVGGTSKVTDFENHYNPELRKCFLVINYTDFTSPYGPTITKILADAYERKKYGEYTRIVRKYKSAWEVDPMECHVTNPWGEKKFCKSEDEFNALAAIYMK